MKVWITVGVAVCWIAVFTVWMVSQDGLPGAANPTLENASATQPGEHGQTPSPRNHVDQRPRPRGFQPHPAQSRNHWRHGGAGRMQREAYGFGLVLLATLDKNKDAVLSETEIARMKEALLTLDENQDGEVSRAELTAAMPAAMAALHGNQEDQPQWDGFRDRWRRWHRRHDNPSDHGDQPGSEEAREPWREARWEAGGRRSEAPWDHGGRSRPAEPSQ